MYRGGSLLIKYLFYYFQRDLIKKKLRNYSIYYEGMKKNFSNHILFRFLCQVVNTDECFFWFNNSARISPLSRYLVRCNQGFHVSVNVCCKESKAKFKSYF